MRRLGRVAIVFGFVALVPVAAYAQAAITGIVRDASGAILPGVTIEAESPALIERARAVVTDGTGQYAIENLRPGSRGTVYQVQRADRLLGSRRTSRCIPVDRS